MLCAVFGARAVQPDAMGSYSCYLTFTEMVIYPSSLKMLCTCRVDMDKCVVSEAVSYCNRGRPVDVAIIGASSIGIINDRHWIGGGPCLPTILEFILMEHCA